MEPLLERISKRTAVIGVVGVGYVGLPLAIELSENQFRVVGIDVSRSVVTALNSGKSTVEGIRDERVKAAVGNLLDLVVLNRRKPAATSRLILDKLLGIDVFIVCVPTPLNQTKESEPDTSYIEQACGLIERVCQIEKKGSRLPKERLIVLESTTYPGTTRKIFSPLLEKYADNERQWYLAYSPERTSPGPGAYEADTDTAQDIRSDEEHYPPTFQITRIVGGQDDNSRDTARALYESVFDEVRTVESLETAEMIKLVENTFRFTSIAFANEMARIAKSLRLNIWEIIDAARSKKFGFELCFPGLIGGHCLPIDPHYLGWTTRNKRVAATFVDVAESEHQNMRREAFDLIQRLLNQQNRGIARASILFLGVSYKKNVGDIRESAAIKLMESLYASGATVSFWDPVRAKHPAKPDIRLIFTEDQRQELPKDLAAQLQWDLEKQRAYVEPIPISGTWDELKSGILGSAYNCVVIATDHNDFRLAYRDLTVSEDAPPIADLCNAISLWLRDADISEDDRKRINRKLNERRNYMLLGLH